MFTILVVLWAAAITMGLAAEVDDLRLSTTGQLPYLDDDPDVDVCLRSPRAIPYLYLPFSHPVERPDEILGQAVDAFALFHGQVLLVPPVGAPAIRHPQCLRPDGDTASNETLAVLLGSLATPASPHHMVVDRFSVVRGSSGKGGWSSFRGGGGGGGGSRAPRLLPPPPPLPNVPSLWLPLLVVVPSFVEVCEDAAASTISRVLWGCKCRLEVLIDGGEVDIAKRLRGGDSTFVWRWQDQSEQRHVGTRDAIDRAAELQCAKKTAVIEPVRVHVNSANAYPTQCLEAASLPLHLLSNAGAKLLACTCFLLAVLLYLMIGSLMHAMGWRHTRALTLTLHVPAPGPG